MNAIAEAIGYAFVVGLMVLALFLFSGAICGFIGRAAARATSAHWDRDLIPPCSVCKKQLGVCRDSDVGPVCGACKTQLVIVDFDMRDLRKDCGIEGCKLPAHEKKEVA